MQRDNRNSGQNKNRFNTGSRASQGRTRWENQNDYHENYGTPSQRRGDREAYGEQDYGNYGYATSTRGNYRDADEYNDALHYGEHQDEYNYEDYDDGEYYENDSYYMAMPGRTNNNYHDSHERWKDIEQSYDDDLYPDDYYNGYENAYGHQYSGDDYGHPDITHENYHYYYNTPTRRRGSKRYDNNSSNQY